VLAYSIFFPVVEILSAISLGFLVWWGVRDVLAGVATVGDLFAYILFINMLFRPDPAIGGSIQRAADGYGGQRTRLQGAGHRSLQVRIEGTRSTKDLRGEIPSMGCGSRMPMAWRGFRTQGHRASR
jgi:ABC-type multidrug transport system fused ATPase/permease subunit